MATNVPVDTESVAYKTYQAVRAKIEAGVPARESFAQVASETGRSAATVQSTYYQTARRLPGGGGVASRPRKRRKAAAAAAPKNGRRRRSAKAATPAARGETASLVRALREACDALAQHAETLGRDGGSGGDAAKLRQIERLLRR